jgi:hypothetical protein
MVIAKYLRENQAYRDVLQTETTNYPIPLHVDCKYLLLSIKDIELRLSSIKTEKLLASKSYSITPIGFSSATLSTLSSSSIPRYSPYMKLEAEEKVLAEIMSKMKAKANSMVCFEEAKAVEETKKVLELDNLITDSNVKATEQIVPQTKKKMTTTLIIGAGILLVALTLILINKKKK